MPHQVLEFDAVCAVVQNTSGTRGQLNVKSTDGSTWLRATLVRNPPENSTHDRSAFCTLDVEMRRADGTSLASRTLYDFEYPGNAPGDHLQDLLAADVLLSYLTGTPVC